jgi:hypothetical protein
MNVKKLAEQAGFVVGVSANADRQIKLFADLVRQDEREACAKACEKVHDDYINDRNNDGYAWPDGHNCADAIRARANT